ncbi:uncharacterized protein LOC143482698 isoform X2 [Brachyhypopomus gauderio]|uniref:uncharacterized protein LOC143482698 isoform X2 n=1 Tax=Brachyhypopomus gauderio TaxID=698409 RepID=UPI0040424A58
MSVKRQTLERQAHNTSTRGTEEQRHKEDSPVSHSSGAEQKTTSTARSTQDPDPSSEETYKGDSVDHIPTPCINHKRVITQKSKVANGADCRRKRNTIGQAPMFPPLAPPYCSVRRIASAQEQCIKQLQVQMWDLERQLGSASQENRALRQQQVRRSAALRHYQDSLASLPQTLRRHSGEVNALQELLRRTREHRDQVARRLRHTQDDLLHTSNTLGRLEQLDRDLGLEERNELRARLCLLSEDLQKKNQKIQDLERHFALNNAYYNRQLSVQVQKTMEAQQLSTYLDNQIKDLTQRIKEKERELQTHNICSHRSPKGGSRRGTKETKSVQTNSVSPLPMEAALCPLEMDYPKDQLETDYPTDQLEMDYPKDQLETDYPKDQLETDHPTDQLETDHPTDQLETDHPTDQLETDHPTDQLETDYPTDQLETDYPTDQLETDYPTDQLEMDHPTDQLEMGDSQKNSKEFYTNGQGTNSNNEEEKQVSSEEEQTAGASENSKNTGIKTECNGEQEEEEEEELSQVSAPEQLTPAEGDNELGFHNLVITQPPPGKATKSPVKIRRHYTFKETIQNLYSGKPAYTVPPSQGRSFRRHCKPRTTPTLLDTSAYEPSFAVPAQKQGSQPAEQSHTSRKSRPLKELSGHIRTVAQMADISTDAGATDQDRAITGHQVNPA